ncbi:hypothetical protein DRN32_07330 [Thermococci archaeon]|nr:MAG: hypothetical protein DRN32_07330 [Thermococci archaeon]
MGKKHRIVIPRDVRRTLGISVGDVG